MDQLFLALPDELQWEILTKFVGTHSVRNGRLKRHMTGEIHATLLRNHRSNYAHLQPNYKSQLIINYRYLNYWQSRCDSIRNMCKGWKLKREWYDGQPSVILPPYEKHEFPSYPYTNRKTGRPLNAVVMHSPTLDDRCFCFCKINQIF